jgi:hypothetical protein
MRRIEDVFLEELIPVKKSEKSAKGDKGAIRLRSNKFWMRGFEVITSMLNRM